MKRMILHSMQNSFQMIFQGLERWAPQLAFKWAIKLWFSPPRQKRRAYEEALIQEARIEKIPFKGGHFLPLKEGHYTTYHWGNKGPTILLVHGWGGQASQMAPFAKPLIAMGYQVIAFDAVAHGESSHKQTDAIEFVRIIKDIVSREGDLHAIISHSFGGMTSAVAIKEGVAAKKLVTIGAGATVDYFLEQFTKQSGASEMMPKKLAHYMESRFNKTMNDFHLKCSVERLSIPGLIVHDQEDQVIRKDEAETLLNHWKNSQLLLTQGLGHRRILSDPHVIEQIIQFIGAPQETLNFSLAS